MFSQYGQQAFACSKRWWFKITWKNIVHKHDPNMVLKSKVFISIMFCVMFWTFLNFNISAVLKNIFFTCYYHVSYMLLFYLSFSYFSSSRKQVLYHVSSTFMLLLPFLALYNKFLQFFLLCFQYFDILLPIKLHETRFIFFW
jgi:hypothetical protein